MYDIEINGSKTYKGQAADLDSLRDQIKKANGRISVVKMTTNEEIFYGNREDLLYAINLAEENGEDELTSLVTGC